MVNYTDEELLYLELAEHVATWAHEGVTRWSNGEPYINHPRRVAHQMMVGQMPVDVVAAAFLHDVIEDTNITAKDLAVMGFTPRTSELVQLLSRPEGETYVGFIQRVLTDPDATAIKLGDICDNLATLEPGHSLAKRYIMALATIHGTPPVEKALAPSTDEAVGPS